MKKLLASLTIFLVTTPAWADVAGHMNAAGEFIASPMPAPTGNWWDSLVVAIVPLLLGALTALSAYLSSLVNGKIKEIKTKEYSQWYGMALNLAGIAVRYAETSFGPDTATGAKKKEIAVNWLMDRLKALDPKINEHIDRSQVAAFVDAAYHDAFTALSPLAQPASVTVVK